MVYLNQIFWYNFSWSINFTLQHVLAVILILLINTGLYFICQRLTVILDLNIVKKTDAIIKETDKDLAIALRDNRDRELEISAKLLLNETDDNSLISKSLATLWSNTTANKYSDLVLFQQIANAKDQLYFDLCCARATYVIEPDHQIVPEKMITYLKTTDLDEFVEKPYLSTILLATINKMNYQTYIASPEYINQLLEITDE